MSSLFDPGSQRGVVGHARRKDSFQIGRTLGDFELFKLRANGWASLREPPGSQLTLKGTPNAQAFSYFLLQHKATLGNLYISEVRVFRNNRSKYTGANLLFIVKPVPANGTKPSTEILGDIRDMFAKLKPHKGTSATDEVKVAVKRPEDLTGSQTANRRAETCSGSVQQGPSAYILGPLCKCCGRRIR